jgi:hypothetical protein
MVLCNINNNIPDPNKFQGPPQPPHYGIIRGRKILNVLLSNKNINIPDPTKIWGPPLPSALWYKKGGGVIAKSCFRVLKRCIGILRGWGRYLKVTMQTRAPKNFRWRRWGAERNVPLCGHGSEDPHRRQRNYVKILALFTLIKRIVNKVLNLRTEKI